MLDVFRVLAETPIPTILVVAGIGFLFVAIGGQLGATVVTTLVRKDLAAYVGAVLVACGLALFAIRMSPPPPPPPTTSAPTPTSQAPTSAPTSAGGPNPAPATSESEQVHPPAAVTYESCLDVSKKLRPTGDGIFQITPAGGLAFDVYCSGMGAGQTPKEYLPLVQTSAQGQRTANYATYYIGSPHFGQTCPCQGPVVARYTRVRLNLVTMKLETSDSDGAELDYDRACFSANQAACSYRPLGYGIAASCAGNSDTRGEANIDLRGTPFRLADANELQKAQAPSGFTSEGRVTASDQSLQVLTLIGGGDCGAFGALTGLSLIRTH